MTKMLASSDFEGLAQALQAPDAGKKSISLLSVPSCMPIKDHRHWAYSSLVESDTGLHRPVSFCQSIVIEANLATGSRVRPQCASCRSIKYFPYFVHQHGGFAASEACRVVQHLSIHRTYE